MKYFNQRICAAHHVHQSKYAFSLCFNFSPHFDKKKGENETNMCKHATPKCQFTTGSESKQEVPHL